MLEVYKLSEAEQDELFYTGLDLEKVSINLGNNPLAHPEIDPIEAVMRIIRTPTYLPFTLENIFNTKLDPIHHATLYEIYRHPFPMLVGSRGFGKSYYLAIYTLWRLLINQGIKIVVTGAGFRQAKFVFEYCQTIWNNAPVLRDLCGNSKSNGCFNGVDKCRIRIGESEAVFIPMGDGSTIRGFRAHINITDEFASLNPEIYEVVVRNFGAVSADPIEKVRELATIEAKKKRGKWTAEMEKAHQLYNSSNQCIVSGSAYYSWNHFYEYFIRYKKIIESQGNPDKLKDIYPKGLPPGFDWKDYCIIRIPYELIPRGFLDEKTVGAAEAMQNNKMYIFNMEFGAVFAEDSNGFFSRKLIESCVVKNILNIGTEMVEPFTAKLCGDPDYRYFMAVDPASENDSFSISIIEVHKNHRRIIYGWTTNKERMQSKISAGVLKDDHYYGLCVKKIKELLALFNVEILSIDTQGGGHAIIELLRTQVSEGEVPILPVLPDHPLSDKKDRDSDNMAGRHIIELVVFRNAQYTSDANHGLRSDFESKVLLFPFFDQIAAVRAGYDDDIAGRLYDTLDDCMSEIEELKDELATIQHSQTPNTKTDKWDTPEVKLDGNKKGRLRKDRYSSLLMANAAARRLALNPIVPLHQAMGGIVGLLDKRKEGALFIGPDWFTAGANNVHARRNEVYR